MTRIAIAPHVHSAWSDDGEWLLEDIAARFARRGYRAVLMCEHSPGFSDERWSDYVGACARASKPNILLVPGLEYNDPDDVVHIPVWGDLPFFGPTPAIGELVSKVSAAGGTSVFAHPWRRDAWRRFDPRWASHLLGLEVWSRKYDGWAPSRRALDLAEREGLRPLVALDFHTRRQFHPLALSAEVDAEVTCDGIYSSLRDGHVEPLAFRRPLDRLCTGVPLLAAETCDAGRRALASAVRAVEGRTRRR